MAVLIFLSSCHDVTFFDTVLSTYIFVSGALALFFLVESFFYYIHTEIYTLKSRRVNFRS